VEEEFLLVDPVSRRLVPRAADVLRRAKDVTERAVEHELQLSQVEATSCVCTTLDGLRGEVTGLRRDVIAAAREAGCAVASCGTHPLPLGERSHITPKPAYLRLEQEYGLVARLQMLCGTHVHVGISDPEVAIGVMNHARPWLPMLLALSVNSPFWQGEDSGFASFRTEVWRRWPIAGLPEEFSSRAEYDEMVEGLLAVGAIDARARLYWDVRPSAKFPTLEFRVADAGLTVEDTIVQAGLTRALVHSCHRDVIDGRTRPAPRPELLRAAAWRAARYGLEGDLIDLRSCQSRPAPDLVEEFLDFLRPALEELGDWEDVVAGVKRIQETGTGAARQRRVYAGTGSLEDVVDFVVDHTDPGNERHDG
jgi:carboxylate-amine ligase